MEYCIDFLVGKLNRARLREPTTIVTTFGNAVRSEEYGKLFWSDELAISPGRQIQPYMLECLPKSHRSLIVYVSLSGAVIDRLAERQYLNSAELDATRLNDSLQLVALLRHLLADQPHWAVWFFWDCDQLKSTHNHTVDELCEAVQRLFWPGSPDALGFLSISRPDARSM